MKYNEFSEIIYIRKITMLKLNSGRNKRMAAYRKDASISSFNSKAVCTAEKR